MRGGGGVGAGGGGGGREGGGSTVEVTWRFITTYTILMSAVLSGAIFFMFGDLAE